MKKTILALAMVCGLFVGCASNSGGTYEDPTAYDQNSNQNFNNNATYGTGSGVATNQGFRSEP